jgi:hypothetical protein
MDAKNTKNTFRIHIFTSPVLHNTGTDFCVETLHFEVLKFKARTALDYPVLNLVY